MHKKAIQLRQKKGCIARCDGRPPRVRPARHHNLKAVGTGDPGSSLMFSSTKKFALHLGCRPSTAADPAVPRFPLQLRRGPLLMFAATRRAAWASCALRACVRFIVARVCVVASTLSVRSRRATQRGYAFREAVGTYKEALEQLLLRLRRQRRVAAAVASAAAKQPWAAITPARTRRLGRSLRGRTPHAPPLGRHVFQRF